MREQIPEHVFATMTGFLDLGWRFFVVALFAVLFVSYVTDSRKDGRGYFN